MGESTSPVERSGLASQLSSPNYPSRFRFCGGAPSLTPPSAQRGFLVPPTRHSPPLTASPSSGDMDPQTRRLKSFRRPGGFPALVQENLGGLSPNPLLHKTDGHHRPVKDQRCDFAPILNINWAGGVSSSATSNHQRRRHIWLPDIPALTHLLTPTRPNTQPLAGSSAWPYQRLHGLQLLKRRLPQPVDHFGSRGTPCRTFCWRPSFTPTLSKTPPHLGFWERHVPLLLAQTSLPRAGVKPPRELLTLALGSKLA